MKKIFFALLLTGLFASCSDSKSTGMKQLKAAYEEVVAHSESYEIDDWSKFLADYQRADSIIAAHHDEYSDEELQEIGRIKGRCAAFVLKAAAADSGKKLHKASEQVKGVVEGFIDGWNSK